MASKDTVSLYFTIDDSQDGLKKLTLDADGLRKVMTENVKITQQLQSTIFSTSAYTSVYSALSRAVSQLNTALNNATAEYDAFDKAMRSANTMAGKSAEGFEELRGQISDLSKAVPIARDQLADGLYQVISNGVPEDNWIEFLKTSARSAVGGMADLNKVVGVTSTIIKNYGLEWDAAASIQDKIQLTAKSGVTSFEHLAQALPRVAGNAATLGVSVEELMGTFSTLTGVSGNTAEVSTQLAAIFTALVKPSKQASDMAAEMGIQFDAAAIKAAGGFQNFLQQLNTSVQAYSQSAGVLEQEIYGRLFGSAEALRALIPLQGELSEKFGQNVAAMVDSAGTMDVVYKEMSGSVEAVTQMLRNHIAAATDWMTSSLSAIKPFLNGVASVLSTGADFAVVTASIKRLKGEFQRALNVTKLLSRATSTLGLWYKSAARNVQLFTKAVKMATVSTKALKIAIRGLLIATAIGAAIAALTFLIEKLGSSSDEASESLELLENANSEYVRGAADARLGIDNEIEALRTLIETNQSAEETVRRLNETYGEYLGTHDTAAEWYAVMTANSQAYVRQMGYEAKARTLLTQIAEKSVEEDMASQKMQSLGQLWKNKAKKSSFVVAPRGYLEAKEARNEARTARQALQKELDLVTKGIENAKAEIAANLSSATTEVETTLGGLNKSLNSPLGLDTSGSKKSVVDIYANPATFENVKQYTALISALRDLQNTANREDYQTLEKKIKLTEELMDLFKRGGSLGKYGLYESEGKIGDLLGQPVTVPVQFLAPDVSNIKIPPLELGGIKDYKNFLEELRKEAEATSSALEKCSTAWGGVQGIAGGMSSISAAFEEGSSVWERFNGVVSGTLQVIQGVQAVMSILSPLIQAATAATTAHTAAQTADTAAQNANSNATMTNAIASLFSANGKIPVAGIAIAAAGVATMLALMLSLPKFAKGGIAYGPTLGLFGEYPGASNNPEVVAPLSDLRKYLNAPAPMDGRVEFVIKGRNLYGLFEAYKNYNSRM